MTLPTIASESINTLTIEKLLANNFKIMTAQQIRDQLQGRTLLIKDLDANSQYELVFTHDNSKTLTKTIEDDPGTLTNTEYQARAQLLTGPGTYSIKDNKVISSDGLREYEIKLYQKNNIIFGARNIDSGRVSFEIKIK